LAKEKQNESENAWNKLGNGKEGLRQIYFKSLIASRVTKELLTIPDDPLRKEPPAKGRETDRLFTAYAPGKGMLEHCSECALETQRLQPEFRMSKSFPSLN
jgi:hypothetical protein